MDHRDFGYTKKKKTAHRCACMHACKATRETGPKRANESDRASERASAVCVTFANLDWSKNVVKTRRYEPGCGRSFLSVASSVVRDIYAPHCTASTKCCFLQLRSPPSDLFLRLSTNLLLFKKQSKAKKRKEKKYNNFHVNNFLAAS